MNQELQIVVALIWSCDLKISPTNWTNVMVTGRQKPIIFRAPALHAHHEAIASNEWVRRRTARAIAILLLRDTAAAAKSVASFGQHSRLR